MYMLEKRILYDYIDVHKPLFQYHNLCLGKRIENIKFGIKTVAENDL